MQLTTFEMKAFQAAFKSATGNGHDFGFVEDVVRAMRPMKQQAAGAVVSSLVKKGVFKCHEPVTTGSGTFTQFTWERPVAEVEALLFNTKAVPSKSTPRSLTMQTQTVKSVSPAFRIVVRGKNAKGKYVRRVKHVRGTYENAWQYANDNVNKLFHGLKGAFINVFEPLDK